MDKRKKINKSANKDNIMLSILFGILANILVLLILSFIFSAISLKFKNPIDYAKIFSFLCLSLSGLCGGLVSSSTYKKNGFLSSICSSAIISLMLILTSINNADSISVLTTLVNPAFIISFGLIGSLINNSHMRKRKIKKYIN